MYGIKVYYRPVPGTVSLIIHFFVRPYDDIYGVFYHQMPRRAKAGGSKHFELELEAYLIILDSHHLYYIYLYRSLVAFQSRSMNYLIFRFPRAYV